MNHERIGKLEEILDMLEADAAMRAQFDMGYWKQNDCGTTFCLAGFYCELFQRGPDAELRLVQEEEDPVEGFYIEAVNKEGYGTAALAEHFGISRSQATQLFCDQVSTPTGTKASVRELRNRLTQVKEYHQDQYKFSEGVPTK
jgi:hypothetical protein